MSRDNLASMRVTACATGRFPRCSASCRRRSKPLRPRSWRPRRCTAALRRVPRAQRPLTRRPLFVAAAPDECARPRPQPVCGLSRRRRRCATSCWAAGQRSRLGGGRRHAGDRCSRRATSPWGSDFPVFLHPETREEYALARTERKHGRGYRGFEFFASPDVTLEEDLERRDLTINAMARDERRHADRSLSAARRTSRGRAAPRLAPRSPRIRCACCASRASRRASIFAVAPETEALMRQLVDGGRARDARARARLAGARARADGARPSRMLRRAARVRRARRAAARGRRAVRRAAAARPPSRIRHRRARAAGARLRAAHALRAAGALRGARARPRQGDHAGGRAAAAHRARAAQHAPCRARCPRACACPPNAATPRVLAARCHGVVHRALELTPAKLLDVVLAADALRRPGRLDDLIAACRADACSRPGRSDDYPQGERLREALAVVRSVDAGAVATRARRARSAADAHEGRRRGALDGRGRRAVGG